MKGRRPATAEESGPELRAGSGSYSPLSTLNFSCRPFRPSISDCWSARNFSSLFWMDLGSLFSSERSRTCCNTAAMSVGPGAAAAAVDGAETEKKGEDQEDPEAWPATSATSLGGSRAPARRRLPRRDPGKPSLRLAAATVAPQRRGPGARAAAGSCAPWEFEFTGGPALGFPGPPSHPLQASQDSGKRIFFLNAHGEPNCAEPLLLPPFSPTPGVPSPAA